MNLSFKNKTVIVTGGAGSIGQEICKQFATQGANVCIFDINADLGFAFENALQKNYSTKFFHVDITDIENLENSFSQVINKFNKIDILINNAGGAFYHGQDNLIATTDPALFHKTVQLNLCGVYNVSKLALDIMRQQQAGVITHVGSVNSKMAFGHPAYSAAKAGLLSLSRSIAVEYGKFNIRSNVVIPGTVKTADWDARLEKNPRVLDEIKKYYPLNTIAEAVDVAHAVCFLSSPYARFISGAELLIDGGLTAGSRAIMADVIVEGK